MKGAHCCALLSPENLGNDTILDTHTSIPSVRLGIVRSLKGNLTIALACLNAGFEDLDSLTRIRNRELEILLRLEVDNCVHVAS
jgi:hypothetical protein